ncbi:aromatic acid exporter family protein [Rhizobium sp. CG5]|uniref:FUSC family protein n=1 Tax=Rhizobium sp. CG5 TaxID=2726076 RepID=UPI0020345FB8|nr:FUSC family protein [Rhizobium sp. CG5]MCM2473916.1 aromatic acid exporter family protein [Rhizobium sp. CG5]
MWGRLVERVRAAFTHALAASIAGALAFWAARLLYGHQQPVFAAITAVICLAPGIPNHLRQGFNLLIGVTIGILVGELIFMIPFDFGEFRIALAIFAAMLVAAMPGLAPVVSIQAGASALLVMVMGPTTGGIVRFLDVIVGVSIGAAFALAFFRRRPDDKA